MTLPSPRLALACAEMSDWRWTPKAAVTVMALFLAFQLTVPAILLFTENETSQRFGWQMFSHAVPDPGFAVVTAAGERKVTLDEVLAGPRADLPLDELVPPFLCTAVPGAIRVTWIKGSYEC